MNDFYIFYYFLFSFAISVGGTFLLIRFCRRFEIFDYPSKHKRHKQATPNLGGTSIFVSSWSAIFLFSYLNPTAYESIRPSLPYIFSGSLLIYLIGLIDDLKPVSAWAKLLVQITAGFILYFGGLSIKLLSIPMIGTVAVDGLAIFITVLWVTALSNAINLIDGLDGLASGVSIIAAVCMTVIGIMLSIDGVVLLSVVLIGALSAFLIFNRYPAKIFLGDSGSLLIGYFFAVISLIVPIKSFTTAALFLPLLILGVPLLEVASSFTRRLVAGKNIMKADRRHIFHYLSYAGLSNRQIVYLFYLAGLIFGMISIAMTIYNRIFVLTILILFMVVIFIIYLIFIGRIRKNRY